MAYIKKKAPVINLAKKVVKKAPTKKTVNQKKKVKAVLPTNSPVS
jgi:hypothetical protein